MMISSSTVITNKSLTFSGILPGQKRQQRRNEMCVSEDPSGSAKDVRDGTNMCSLSGGEGDLIGAEADVTSLPWHFSTV